MIVMSHSITLENGKVLTFHKNPNIFKDGQALPLKLDMYIIHLTLYVSILENLII